jgi:hypothetical protein
LGRRLTLIKYFLLYFIYSPDSLAYSVVIATTFGPFETSDKRFQLFVESLLPIFSIRFAVGRYWKKPSKDSNSGRLANIQYYNTELRSLQYTPFLDVGQSTLETGQEIQ